MNKKRITGAIVAIAALTCTTTLFAADGKALYEEHCAKCHGTDGKGDTKMGKKLGTKDYSSPKTWEGVKDDAAIKAVKEGVKDKEGKVVMKPTEGVSDADAKAMVGYMKSLKK